MPRSATRPPCSRRSSCAESGDAGAPDGFAPVVDVDGGEGEGEGEGEEPPPPSGAVTVSVRETNRWNSGACFSGDVDNGTGGDAVWEGVLDVEGALTDHWNSEAVELGDGRERFSGAAWNVSLSAGAHADVFGYCVGF